MWTSRNLKNYPFRLLKEFKMKLKLSNIDAFQHNFWLACCISFVFSHVPINRCKSFATSKELRCSLRLFHSLAHVWCHSGAWKMFFCLLSLQVNEANRNDVRKTFHYNVVQYSNTTSHNLSVNKSIYIYCEHYKVIEWFTYYNSCISCLF